MGKSFMKFFSEKKDIVKIAMVFGLGLILMFIGNSSANTSDIEQGVEERIATACSGVDGVGNCSVLVYYTPFASRDDEQRKVESVIVICEGADSPQVRLTLTEMLSSFFGIGTNRVRIEKMKK